jgi:hypothetical protein
MSVALTSGTGPAGGGSVSGAVQPAAKKDKAIEVNEVNEGCTKGFIFIVCFPGLRSGR